MKKSASPLGEGLCRDQRLRRRTDYLRCYRRGRKKHGSLASIHFHTNESEDVRLGITASRKVGHSVMRHRLKRWVREIFRRFDGRAELRPLDIVVHLKPAASRVQFAALSEDVQRLLSSLKWRQE